jgi:beta-propeller repeat-containing protein
MLMVLTTPLGCREPTEAVVEISTDSVCDQKLETGITPGPLGDIETRDYGTTTSMCQSGDIGSIVLLPPGDDQEAPFAFKIVTSLGKPVETCVAPAYGQHCIVARRAMRFVPHHTYHVPIRMSLACAGVSCPADQTCIDGVCLTNTLDPAECDTPEGCDPQPGAVPPFQKQFGGAGQELARQLAMGDDGTLALTGTFEGTLDLGGKPLVSQGGGDIFFASFSRAGLFRWATSFGGKGLDEGASVAMDAHGGIYLFASFENTLTFGGDPLVSKGGTDAALVKFTSDGTLLWARQLGGAANETPGKVAVDAGGNVYVTGEFSESTSIQGTKLVSAGGTDVFLASFDASGNLRWARALGGPGDDGANGVGTDAAGHLYLAGYFSDQAAIGAPKPLRSAGAADVFVASFEGKDGSYRWSKAFGSPANDVALDLRARGSRIAVTGTLAGKATIDGVALPAGEAAGFVLAFNTEGKLDWSRLFGSESHDRGSSIDISPNGQSIVLGGETASGTVFESTALKPKSDRNPFIAVLNADGTTRWSRSYPSSFFAAATAVAAPNDGFAYLAGWFSDKLVVENETLVSEGKEDMILLRVAPPAPAK